MTETAEASSVPTPDEFAAPELFINRELSLLEFNDRVLAQARDESVPLLERLKFLCISSTNLDEFFEVRVAGLKQKAELLDTPSEADNRTPSDVLRAISQRAHTLVDKQYATLNDEIIPALQAEGIRFLRRAEWNAEQRAWLAEYFEEELLPVISPIGLDPAHPFPRILNKSLNFIVSLDGTDAFGRKIRHAVVQAPRALPRIIQLPPETTGSGPHDFVFLSSIIHEHVGDLFPSMRTDGCYQFRVTRNSDLLRRRGRGRRSACARSRASCLRVATATACAWRWRTIVRRHFRITCSPVFCSTREDLYQVNGRSTSID